MHSLVALPLLLLGVVLLMGPTTGELTDNEHIVTKSQTSGQSTPATDLLLHAHRAIVLSGPEGAKQVSDKNTIDLAIENNGHADLDNPDANVDLEEVEEEEESEDDHHVEKRDLSERIRQHMLEQQQQQRPTNYTGCDTCRKMHMDMKQASLEHIKKYVLSILGFNKSGPPKKTGAWPEVNSYIMEQYRAAMSGTPFSPGDEWEEERVSHQQQQRYMDMHGAGAASEQDYMADDPNWNVGQQQQQDEAPFVPVIKTNRIYLFANGECGKKRVSGMDGQ